uniref:Immunoglobulin C1-set domain-containing protein n=1 Tax=Bos indicus x Bos taurus TaxID=30522 RepID=A0A4W2I3Q1_BOBOX
MYVSLIILFNSLPFPPTDRRLDGDLFPKPTIFFPSVEEVKLHGAGTHLCLLQNFFPDAIKIQWKEKNVNTILESYQGNIIKTNDTYMKFSWLTLTKKAMDKEHVCIVKHENNKGGRDQQILFSPVKKDCSYEIYPKQKDTLQLQFANTSAYYTYLLLLLKSTIYFSIIAFCVFWRTGIFSDGKIF